MRTWKIAVPAAVLLAALVLAALWGGGGPVTVALNDRETPVTLAEDEHVWLTPSAVTAAGMTVTLHREGASRVGYGDPYYIAQKDHHNSRKWAELPWLEEDGPTWWRSLTIMGFDPEGTDTGAGEAELREDWTDVYGPLEPGEYLFVKEVLDPDDPSAGRYIGAEFTVR